MKTVALTVCQTVFVDVPEDSTDAVSVQEAIRVTTHILEGDVAGIEMNGCEITEISNVTCELSEIIKE